MIMKVRELISLRKINALLVIIIVLMLLNHAVRSLLYLYGLIPHSPSFQITGRRVFMVLCLHIILSLYLYFRDKSRRNGITIYPDIIKETNFQVISGICILFFMILHVVSYSYAPADTTMSFFVIVIHFIVDNLLFVSITIHLSVSLPRLLVSLGFLSKNKESYEISRKRINIILGIIFVLLFIAEIIFYIFKFWR